jgi:putative flippase GtrA
MFFTRQFLAFVVAGGTSVVFNLAARHALSAVVPFEAAVAMAYVVGVAVAFAMNRWLVFRDARGSLARQGARFAAVNLVGLAQVWLVSVALLRWVFPALSMQWHAEWVAHFLGLATLTVTSFVAHKRYSFR